MADCKNKHPFNVPGRFYVDTTCLDHECCTHIAPQIFRMEETAWMAYVVRQPVTPEEEALVREAIETCPMGAIGDDGHLEAEPRESWEAAREEHKAYLEKVAQELKKRGLS